MQGELNRKENYRYTDLLTKLPNCIFFHQYLSQRIGKIVKYETIGVIVIDLEEFKYIHNSFDHNLGNQLIRKVGNRLVSQIATLDIPKVGLMARMEGDKFILLIENIKKKKDLKIVAEKFMSIFQRPFTLENDLEVYITASIGISLYPIDGEDADTLINHARIAMYQAKKLGKNNFCFYDKDKNNHNLVIINDLVKAIYHKEFELYYQPKIDVKSMKLIGVEALIRWNHPNLGLIFPDQFIPLAQKAGLIMKIDELVMEKACMQNKIWQRKGFRKIPISINISPNDLDYSNFYDKVKNILEETKLNPKYLEIEVTESDMIQNREYAIKNILKLKNLGIKITMDDFGKGYTSIINIKNLHFDALKIDKNFVIDLNRNNVELIRGIIAMAKVLGISVTAEGVEKKEHMDFLKQVNCNYVQGYLFSKPLSIQDFTEKWLKK